MNKKLEQFKTLIANAKNIVFFGGAGVSTESGIPDFRSKTGLYNLKSKYGKKKSKIRSILIEKRRYKNGKSMVERKRCLSDLSEKLL